VLARHRLGFKWLARQAGLPALLETTATLLSRVGLESAPGTITEQHRPKKEDQALLGNSPAMRRLRQHLSAVAHTDATVLLCGETGTGKELAARFLHKQSIRADRRFVAVNCAALTETLLESELFGHEKGAFTGAHRQKAGKFEYAGRGTVFLDEIGELSPHLQAKMLRVLDDREYERVGGNRTLQVQCRIIAASNINFARAIREGRFREDLYYRLNVVTIDLPPLREHPEDIPLLARHFLKTKSTLHGKSIAAIPGKILDNLIQHPWPGNVRELENLIERAVILSRANTLSIPPVEEDPKVSLPEILPPMDTARTLRQYTEEVLMQCEKEYFHRLLSLHRGHISKTAKDAGIDRKTFYRKIRRCGLDPKQYKDSSFPT
jgi:transcriptional regulator with PAS, ATPase and Fis domain